MPPQPSAATDIRRLAALKTNLANLGRADVDEGGEPTYDVAWVNRRLVVTPVAPGPALTTTDQLAIEKAVHQLLDDLVACLSWIDEADVEAALAFDQILTRSRRLHAAVVGRITYRLETIDLARSLRTAREELTLRKPSNPAGHRRELENAAYTRIRKRIEANPGYATMEAAFCVRHGRRHPRHWLPVVEATLRNAASAPTPAACKLTPEDFQTDLTRAIAFVVSLRADVARDPDGWVRLPRYWHATREGLWAILDTGSIQPRNTAGATQAAPGAWFSVIPKFGYGLDAFGFSLMLEVVNSPRMRAAQPIYGSRLDPSARFKEGYWDMAVQQGIELKHPEISALCAIQLNDADYTRRRSSLLAGYESMLTPLLRFEAATGPEHAIFSRTVTVLLTNAIHAAEPLVPPQEWLAPASSSTAGGR